MIDIKHLDVECLVSFSYSKIFDIMMTYYKIDVILLITFLKAFFMSLFLKL